MAEIIRAVIFDMDGVLIDSEHLWRIAMMKGFEEAGMGISEDECRETMGRRFTDVVSLWATRFDKKIDENELVNRVTDILIALIDQEGKAIDGIPGIIDFCKRRKLKMGLATSSSNILMKKVIARLKLASVLDATISAEFMKYAKPHPQVFLDCAESLGVAPEACIVIEDSLNGVIAAKAARMQVVAVPDEGFRAWQQFAIADHQLNNMHETLILLEKLVPSPISV